MQGKVVLITGAASGIAAATSVMLATRGCMLSLVDKDEASLQVTVQKCVEAGSKNENVHAIVADLAKMEELEIIVNSTLEKFQRIDVLLNIAGVAVFGNLNSTTEEDYDAVMSVNLKAVFFLTKLAMPHVIKAKGNVVSVSSVGAQRAAVGAVAYCMGKAALDLFTKSVALEVSSHGVRVNAVNPSNVKTKFLQGLDIDEIGQKLHALRRPGTPEEIAKAIVFLADDDTASFITGTTLLVDGGMSLMGPV